MLQGEERKKNGGAQGTRISLCGIVSLPSTKGKEEEGSKGPSLHSFESVVNVPLGKEERPPSFSSPFPFLFLPPPPPTPSLRILGRRHFSLTLPVGSRGSGRETERPFASRKETESAHFLQGSIDHAEEEKTHAQSSPPVGEKTLKRLLLSRLMIKILYATESLLPPSTMCLFMCTRR